MTDVELILKKLAEIEGYLRDLRTRGEIERLRDMAGFRNLLVHGYAAVDLSVVEDVVRNHLGDLDAFGAAIRDRLQA